MKKYGKYVIALLFITLIASIFLFDLQRFFTPEAIRDFVEQFGLFGPIAYMVIYYLAIVFFLPATVFTVLAGLLFGKVFGSIYVVIAATLAAQTAFLIARYLGKQWAERLSGKGKLGSLLEKINTKVQKNGFQAFVLLRCLFLPYIPLSYAAGLVPTAKGRDFFLATLVTNMIFSPAFVFFGDAITKGPKAFILPVLLIITVLLVPRILGKLRITNDE